MEKNIRTGYRLDGRLGDKHSHFPPEMRVLSEPEVLVKGKNPQHKSIRMLK